MFIETPFTPENLADWTGGIWLDRPRQAIRGFCFDARKIRPGECFIALPGMVRNGHEFIRQAAAGGAAAALVESSRQAKLPQLQVDNSLLAMARIARAIRAQFEKPLVGITGSCGKTSTKEMLAELLGGTRCHATVGNRNNRIGVPMSLFGLDSVRQDFAVIEAGISEPDEMRHLAEMIEADWVIITNIGPAHLEGLGSLKRIASEKSELLLRARPNAPCILPVSVLDHVNSAEITDRAIVLVHKDVTVPIAAGETIHYDIKALPDEASQWLHLSGHSYRIRSTSHGIAVNAALAITAASRLGISREIIRRKIQAWQPFEGRGRIRKLGKQTVYMDCYNANPTSMVDALRAFIRANPESLPRLYVLGAMDELGDFAEAAHEKTAQQLSLRKEDQACFVGPKRLTDAYCRGAIASGGAPAAIVCAENVKDCKGMVADFEGALFLKGSRSYQLEQLIQKPIYTTI